MINLQWLELSMSQINFHGPKDVELLIFFNCFSIFGIVQPILVSLKTVFPLKPILGVYPAL